MEKGEKGDKQWLKKLFDQKAGSPKKKNTIQYVIMILCVGVGLMILGNFIGEDNSAPPSEPVFNDDEDEKAEPALGRNSSSGPMTMEDYEIRYENQLREVLEQMIGVSDVSIMINLAETEKSVYERNISTKHQKTDETDREGGTRKVDDLTRDEQVVIIRNGDSEEPLLVKKQKPEIRGVLVVAQGTDNIQVKSRVVEAVSRVLDVPAHRVSVMPKKLKEE
ncbi:stage III sporulation protein AG [Alkalihalobacillus sp. BA299]|uniref:stage III sporulation protein AG n=1 Tax=Alkalihalobacillus sp. BA299 TaxID=2815938 RepID=UPI001ADB72B7|nr:stage III sporulation protein AG [Alkalihalobacillus sp. BA299]